MNRLDEENILSQTYPQNGLIRHEVVFVRSDNHFSEKCLFNDSFT
jgi:hypothetical protein